MVSKRIAPPKFLRLAAITIWGCILRVSRVMDRYPFPPSPLQRGEVWRRHRNALGQCHLLVFRDRRHVNVYQFILTLHARSAYGVVHVGHFKRALWFE